MSHAHWQRRELGKTSPQLGMEQGLGHHCVSDLYNVHQLAVHALQKGKHRDSAVTSAQQGVYASSVRQLLGKGLETGFYREKAPAPLPWTFLCQINMRVITQKAVFVSSDYQLSWQEGSLDFPNATSLRKASWGSTAFLDQWARPDCPAVSVL